MKKKISILAIALTILFGGVFASSASAATSDQTQVQQNFSYKVFYSFNGWSDYFSGNDWWKKIFSPYKWQSNQDQKDVNQQDQKEQKPSDNKANEPKSEKQPAPEQPKKEQPKKEVEKEQEKEIEKAPEKEQEKAPEKEVEKEQQVEETPVKEEVTEQKQEQPEQTTNELNEFEQQVVQLTNEERSKHGLQPLKIDTELSKVAREKSRDMATNNYFSHNSPTYGSPFDMMKQFGVDYRTAGENIAKGQRTPQQVVNAWMNSEDHRANILNGNFTHIGVGYVEQGNHWTQQFIGK
ncbi:CAP domain-containing protein [Allobacillus sp. GCM10007491]|uniref:SCP domain-containing protein n=1 Tax=Allobacillus saliphilus TaxID=2912308 RepID=A0A941CVV5_9BACI|nr:CAP domain-containing protein [Allobacillus saliphilus]MBR7553471.1 hypothetical protein [Allobacillus saliphilus]